MRRRSESKKQSSVDDKVKNNEINERADLETDRQDRKDRDKRQTTRQNETQAARQQTRRQTEGYRQTDSDRWARRHTVQCARRKGRGMWVVGEKEGGGAGHRWGIE